MAAIVNGTAASVAARTAERVRAALVTATAHSAVVTRSRALAAGWRQQPWPERRLKTGCALTIAAGVHMLLLGRAHGWTEFILPITALLVGLIAIATAVSGTTRMPHE